MSNSLIIGIVLAVMVAGGGYVLVSKQKDKTGSDSDSAMKEEGGEAPESFTGTIGGLLSLGQNVTCTFSRADENGTVNGTVYLAASGQRIRGDFEMTSSQGNMNGSMIRRDGMNYTWGDTPFGTFAMKSSIDVEAEGTAKKDNQGVDFDEEIDYTCSPWRVDSSKFDLPTGVEFQDINAEVNQINASVGATLDLQCGACDSIPDAAAQAQCKAALGC